MTDVSKDRIAGVFCAIVMVAALMMAAANAGCGFQAALAKTHQGVKGMSKVIEPPLAAECLKRAKACADAGKAADACPPLTECRGWKASYVLGAQGIHTGAARLNRLYDDLKKFGVIP